MPAPKVLTLGDKCPADGGELVKAYVPSDDEFRRATDKENPQTLPPRADSASPETRAELGTLYRCASCGYQTRFKPEPKKPATQPAAAAPVAD